MDGLASLHGESFQVLVPIGYPPSTQSSPSVKVRFFQIVKKITEKTFKLGEKIVILEQLRTVSVIAEKCYQILYLLLSPSYFNKILKA